MEAALVQFLTTLANDHPYITLALLAWASLDGIVAIYAKGVTTAKKLQLHTRRLLSEPDPRLLND